jgi:hypothetical protein
MRQAILFLTNKSDKITLKNYRDFSNDLIDIGDTHLVYHQTRSKISKAVANHTPFIFKDSILQSLGYKPVSNSLVPGNTHFPIFKFYKAYPQFDYYWCIEDDVRYGDTWKSFFNYFLENNINSDLLTSNIKFFKDAPDWHWWNSLSNVSNVDKLRCFNPVVRISKFAMKFLDQLLLSGQSGHHEVLIPTFLYNNGFNINDIGGEGPLVLDNCHNRFYKLQSMRFRPLVKIDEITEPILYHPVKIYSERKSSPPAKA